MKQYVNTTIVNKIARIKFYSDKGNSFTSEQLASLSKAIEVLNNNIEITIIILESEGNSVFCSGASFDELLSINEEASSKIFFSGFAQVILALKKSSKIVIGNIQGKTVGGGVGLIAACDYVIATKNTQIKLSELAIGIGPFVIEPVISYKIGKTAMADLMLNPTEWKDSIWALNKGLFTKVFDTIEDSENYLDEYSKKLSQYNPDALIEIKKILWENTEHWNDLLKNRAAVSGKLALSNFTKNTLKQFKKI